jgi:hypothetical protein
VRKLHALSRTRRVGGLLVHHGTVIVFGILAHQDPQHLVRLAQRLAPYRAVVHLDRKSDRPAFERALTYSPNAFLLPETESFDVRWAGMSVVDAEFAVLERARTFTAPNDYIVLLSGADYPLRPVAELDRFLSSSGGTQFIRYFRIRDASKRLHWSITSRHFNDWRPLGNPYGILHRKVNTAIRLAIGRIITRARPPRLPGGIDPVFGSQFFGLTRECVDEVLGLRTEALDAFFKNVYSPDEKYIHTLVSLSSYHEKTPDGGYAAAPVRDETSASWMSNLHHPLPITKWYTLADWDEVSESDMWFLRKVRTSDGASLLNRIDRERLGITK